MVPTPTPLRNGNVSLHPAYRYTSIWRPLDPRYPTNRAIVLIALVVAVVRGIFLLATNIDIIQSVSIAGSSGFTVLLAWIVGRELDPDHNASAFIAAGLALIALTQFSPPNIVAVFWTVVMMRILNQTVAPAKWIDSIALLALATWLSLTENWLYAPLTALSFAVDAFLPDSARRRQLFFAIAAIGLTFISVLLTSARTVRSSIPITREWLIAEIIIAILFGLLILSTRKFTSTNDRGDRPLDPRRVRAAQGMALLSAFAWGFAGIAPVLAVWTAMLGVVLYRVWMLLSLIKKSA